MLKFFGLLLLGVTLAEDTAAGADVDVMLGSEYVVRAADGNQYILWEVRDAILSQGVGYGVILGFGAFFSICTIVMHKVYLNMSGGKETTSDFFTAGRNIGTGLTAAVIVSQWTWAATLLQSSSVGYKFGVSGPFWYASGASVQILLFGVIAVYMKKNTPKAHTFLEIVKARFGPNVHKVFLVFALMTNFIVTSMLILGGSAVVEDLTGVPKELAAFLIPLGVIAYTMSGGLLATFVASYVHTGIIMAMLCIFVYTVYTGPLIGGSDGMWDALEATQNINVIDKAAYEADGTIEVVYDKIANLAGNQGNSYLTMSSAGGLMFGVINIVGNFGTVFVDQSYWQSAVAAKPSASVPGFLIGGLVWFAIPFCLATTFGLTGAACNLPLSGDEVGAGLVAAKAATFVMGPGGGVGLLIMLFMAVTSTGSAELIAVTSLFTYDVYMNVKHEYLETLGEDEKDEHLKKVSRIFIVVFGLIMGAMSFLLQQIGLSLGYVYLLMGVLIGSAVAPSFAVVVWKKLNATAATVAVLGGFVCATSAWLITAAALNDGEISIKTTGQDVPLLVGNIMSLSVGALLTVVFTLMNPSEEVWADVNDRIPGVVSAAVCFQSEEEFEKYRKMSVNAGLILTFFLIVLWPMPMYFSNYVFSKPFFAFWVVLCFIWSTIGTAVIVIMPLHDAYVLYTDYSKSGGKHDAVPTKETEMEKKPNLEGSV